MLVQYLGIIGFYLVVLVLLYSLMRKLQEKFWLRFSAVMFPFLLVGHILFNVISFPAVNQARWRLRRLPSNDLIDLMDNSYSQRRTYWIYPLMEIYYAGRTLQIPENLLDSLPLSKEELQRKGRLAEVVPIEMIAELTEGEVELILAADYLDISIDDGYLYHFVMQETDLDSPLLLRRYEDRLFFIPKDLLPDTESGL